MTRTIDEVYAEVPALECKGLCQAGCGPIGCSDAEASALQNDGINLPTVRVHPTEGELTCSHLGDDGRCAIYDRRPLICRLWGAAERLRCPHGCRPKGGLMDDARAKALLDELDAQTGRPPYVAPIPGVLR